MLLLVFVSSKLSKIWNLLQDEIFRDPKLTAAVLSTYCSGFKKFKLSHLKPSNKPTGDWLTMGVIVSKGEFKKSAKNHEYMIWKLSDLSVSFFHDC